MATARKLPSGSWRVRVYVGTNGEGKKEYKSFTGRTKKEAEKMALSYTAQQTHNEDITFGEALRRYIESKSSILSPSTISGYMTIEKNYVDRLKNIKIDRITNEVLQKQLDDIASNYSAKTVNNVRALITATMKMFMPALTFSIKAPQKEKVNVKIPTDEDMRRLIQSSSGTKIEIPILLSAFGSLRRSEVCALLPDCVHDTYIEIRRAYVHGPDGWVINERPKTYAGYRNVPLPPDIMQKVKAAAASCPDDQPIVNYKPSGLFKSFRRATKRAGIYPYKYHSLRHYFATFCHSIGIPDQYIMEMGGWDDIGTLTKIYQHTMENKKDDMNKKINQYYTSVSK